MKEEEAKTGQLYREQASHHLTPQIGRGSLGPMGESNQGELAEDLSRAVLSTTHGGLVTVNLAAIRRSHMRGSHSAACPRRASGSPPRSRSEWLALALHS